MAADIMEGPDLAGLVAAENDRDARDHERNRVAGVRHVTGKADAHPDTRKQPFPFEIEKLLARVRLARQATGVLNRHANSADGLFSEKREDGLNHRTTP